MGTSKLDVDEAIVQVDTAGPASLQRCAHFVRLAIEAGGVNLVGYPNYAKHYRPCLNRAGFGAVPATRYRPLRGDVIVFQSYEGGNPAGHIEMYDGKQWVSDFKQPSQDIWPGPGYRAAKPAYELYRP